MRTSSRIVSASMCVTRTAPILERLMNTGFRMHIEVVRRLRRRHGSLLDQSNDNFRRRICHLRLRKAPNLGVHWTGSRPNRRSVDVPCHHEFVIEFL